MIPIALALAATSLAAPLKQETDLPFKGVAPVCQRAAIQQADGSGSALFRGSKGTPVSGMHKLSDEPNADMISAVLYSEGQCAKPIVISRDIGVTPKRK